MHPKPAAWRYLLLSPELCRRVAFAEQWSRGKQGAVPWLFAGAKEVSGKGFAWKTFSAGPGLGGMSQELGMLGV